MTPVTIVGSGPSGVHFALSLLRKGLEVRMIDAGRKGRAAVEPGLNASELKLRLPDPVEYFLGKDLYGLTLPGAEAEFYGFPPQKRFVFERPTGLREQTSGFEPLSSWAQGGLARAWTAGVYPFNEAELSEFPFGFEALEADYSEVADRIGVMGELDDLADFMPWHAGIEDPLKLDQQSDSLMRRYRRVRARVNAMHRCYLGRSRLAVLAAERDGRSGCGYLGRCLWGCPTGSLYTPEMTLAECRQYAGFTYEPDRLVDSFQFDENRRVTTIRTRPVMGGAATELPVETLALACGTLATARILLTSWYRATGERRILSGLMDNRQVLVPFVHLPSVGRRFEPQSYQYHQLSMGLPCERDDEYVHGQITTLTAAQAHPIMETMPFDLRLAGYVFRNARAALGLVNLNFHDRRRESCHVTLGEDDPREGPEGLPTLQVRYEPSADEPARMRRALRRVRGSLRKLGCVVVPRATRVRPMGASVHYAGTLPMSIEDAPSTVTPGGRSRDFENLYVVDGSTFPFLPAKNITFSLMANAVRIARESF